jgi:hypothetical protein
MAFFVESNNHDDRALLNSTRIYTHSIGLVLTMKARAPPMCRQRRQPCNREFYLCHAGRGNENANCIELPTYANDIYSVIQGLCHWLSNVFVLLLPNVANVESNTF